MMIAEYIKHALDAADLVAKAREGYERGSFGYHAGNLIMAKHDAADKLEAALEQLIRDTVHDILAVKK